jgi:minor histocompatibility antigen H13
MNLDLLSSYVGLLLLASTSVYVGSFGSLPSSHAGTPHAKESSESGDDDEPSPLERLTTEDAYIFPILGSAVLFGLYLMIRYLGPEWINVILRWYTSITGIGSVWKLSTASLRFLAGSEKWRQYDKFQLSFSKGKSSLLQMSWRTPTLYALPVSCLPSLLYNISESGQRSALLSNIIALSFCYSGMTFIKLDSFATGCVLLSGLFVYDIWWVFGTEVMVKVATSIDVPIKLLWPKSLLLAPAHGFTMLGLGDVVIPGTFVALALRYDYRHHKGERDYNKPYFYTTIGAYIFSLVVTMSVMHVFRTGQPALLYISPMCISALIGRALLKGELKELWEWRDEDGEEEMRKVD